ncbi:MAG: hypothetical protein RLZZ416_333 [Candidatus Parcubacteria bacterium]|jgi:YidC/Oxa1 family membrane protein insertase
MLSAFFHAAIYDPLYNGLVFLVGVVPGNDIGLAVILLTIIVRIIIYPLSKRAILSQLAMKKIAPEVEELKKKYKNNSAEQGAAIFALYRERDIHPFASFGLLLVQFPILIGLYFVFLNKTFPGVDPTLLYPFIEAPSHINMQFLGLLDMSAHHNIPLAILVALSQLVYSRLSMGPREKILDSTPVEATLSGDMAKSFDLQARYVFPLIFGVISYSVAAAAPLYWLTSNLFMIGQELAMGKRFTTQLRSERA